MEARTTRVLGGVLLVCLLCALPAASAAGAPATLAPGDTGKGVRRLQVRVAGWYPHSLRQRHFALDGVYGIQTVEAVRAFQRRYGIRPSGIAGPTTWAALRRLGDVDGSTSHFDWSEFRQNHNAACSAQANAYAGTFRGGLVAKRRIKRNVRRLMWRLEALRAKGHRAVGINSAFRSRAYNNCIGGAGASQHLFGTAADNRMAEVSNHWERRLAKRTEFHGIGCYAGLTHNHFDVRIDNHAQPETRSWWWPRKDAKGRDLDANGKLCWGEPRKKKPGREARLAPGAPASIVLSVAELKAWAASGEPRVLAETD